MFRQIPFIWKVVCVLLAALMVTVGATTAITRAVRIEYNCLHKFMEREAATQITDVSTGKSFVFPVFGRHSSYYVQHILRGTNPHDKMWIVLASDAPISSQAMYTQMLLFKDKRTSQEYSYAIKSHPLFISPDGQYLLYRDIDATGRYTYAIRSLHKDGFVSVLPHQIETFRWSLDSLLWSPDSRHIAIYGSNEIRLAQVPAGAFTAIVSNLRFPTYASQLAPVFWTGDGSRLIYLGWQRSTGTYLVAHDPLTGESNTLATKIWEMPTLSPDSNYVLVNYRRENSHYDSVLINLVTGKNIPVRTDAVGFPSAQQIFWQDDLFLAVYPDAVVWMHTDGTGYGEVDLTGTVSGTFSAGRLEGSRFYLEELFSRGALRIIVIDLNAKTKTVAYEGRAADGLVISPDLKKVAFYSVERVGTGDEQFRITLTVEGIESGSRGTFVFEGNTIPPLVWAPDSTKLYVKHIGNGGSNTGYVTYSVVDASARLLTDIQIQTNAANHEPQPVWTRCDRE